MPAGLILAGAAQLVPGIISLLSRPKTITTGTVPFDDLTAAVAVAGHLKGGNKKRHIFHDQFRLVHPGTNTERAVAELRRNTIELADLRTRLETAVPPGGNAFVPSQVVRALTLVTQVISGIDAFLEGLETVPDGATRSPRVTAILQEAVRAGALHVLLVKAQSASGMQLVANNLVSADKFSVLVAATISWMLTDKSGEIVAAGLTTGTAQAGGKIGSSFEFDH